MSKTKATIVQLQNFSVNDGDGIRTTIFLMGCPLRCLWCSNPETWQIDSTKATYNTEYLECNKCGLSQKNNVDLVKCPNCSNKLEKISKEESVVLGYEVDIPRVIKIIDRQEIFYRYSNGGVTFSGGEPTVQLNFLNELSNKLENMGVNMWMETCGYFDYEKTKEVLKRLSHLFIDIKCMDENTHIEYTGVSNKVILDNIIKIKELNLPMTIRIPAINEVNFNNDNLIKTLEFIKNNFNNYPITVEFLPFHNLGKDKYHMLNIDSHLHKFSAPTKKRLQEVKELFESNGIKIVEYR